MSLDCGPFTHVLLEGSNLLLNVDYFLFDLVPVAHERVLLWIFDLGIVVVEEARLSSVLLLYRHPMDFLLTLSRMVN